MKHREAPHFHMIHFYMTRLARETWKESQLGVGAYTMQGFEKFNSELKHIFKTSTNKKNNKKTNVFMQILKTLQYKYEHKNIEKREKKEKKVDK